MKPIYNCFAHKPGKNEIPRQTFDWSRVQYLPDCDRKRTTMCRVPSNRSVQKTLI